MLDDVCYCALGLELLLIVIWFLEMQYFAVICIDFIASISLASFSSVLDFSCCLCVEMSVCLDFVSFEFAAEGLSSCAVFGIVKRFN